MSYSSNCYPVKNYKFDFSKHDLRPLSEEEQKRIFGIKLDMSDDPLMNLHQLIASNENVSNVIKEK